MSSILKALRRLEEEKSARSERPVRFAWDVLRPSREPSVRQRAGLLRAVGFLLLGSVALGGGWIAGRVESVVETTGPVRVTGFIPLPASAAPAPRIVQQALIAKNTLDDQLRLDLIDGTPQGGRLAVINDLPVMEGSMVEGYRVVAILADQVMLIRDDRPYTLRLTP